MSDQSQNNQFGFGTMRAVIGLLTLHRQLDIRAGEYYSLSCKMNIVLPSLIKHSPYQCPRA